jgi:hypothetical protein
LLFGLYKLVWIITFSTCLNPHFRAPTCPFTLEVLWAKEHTLVPFVVFILGFAFESIKEFGGASRGLPRRGTGPLRGGGGPPSRSGPPSGGRGGGIFPIRGENVFFGAPWPNSPWNPWYPPWYLPLALATLVVPSSRQTLPYLIYFTKTNFRCSCSSVSENYSN